jgi:hypothetical protein
MNAFLLPYVLEYTIDILLIAHGIFLLHFFCISCVMESFDCLTVVMRLNHKLLEPWLTSLWLYLMVTHPILDTDPLGQESVTTFAKLRQVNLIMIISSTCWTS